jgi:hypothetical protein
LIYYWKLLYTDRLGGIEMQRQSILPYDKTNPIIYENDEYADVYTDEYLFALASSGEIDLRGLITTISFTDSWQKPEIQYTNLINGRKELVGKARRSGMRNIPDPTDGPSVSLVRPESGIIEDTKPINTPGSRLIVKEAKKASPEKPLVIIMGGQSTAVADAYLLDNSIIDSVVIAWLVGHKDNDMHDYNGWVDPWGTYIIISRFKTVTFGMVGFTAPVVPKQRLYELPDTELRQYMIEKCLPHVNLPGEHDFDAQPAIPLMRPDYAKNFVKKSFSHFTDEGMPVLKDDDNGNVMAITEADQDVATEEWWRAMKDPKAYGGNTQKPVNTPYNGEPVIIPGVIAAAEFDCGGEGVSFHCSKQRNGSLVLKTAYRMTDHVSYDYCEGAKDTYVVEPMETGEWLEYTIKAEKSGVYRIKVIAASAACGGVLHINIGDENKSGIMNIPSTGGWQNWIGIVSMPIFLKEGVHILRVTTDSGMFTLREFEITLNEA